VSAFLAAIRPAVDKLVELGRPRPGDAVLHLGCGTGMIALLAAQRVLPRGKVIGADASADRLRVAAANAAQLGLGVSFEHVHAGELPWKPQSFDLIFCGASSIAEVVPLLRPGGRLAVLELGASSRNRFVTVPAELLGQAGVPIAPLEPLWAGERLDVTLRELGVPNPLLLRLPAQLCVRSARDWWSIAADAAGWPSDAFEHISGPLEQARSHLPPGSDATARFSVEVVLASAKVDASPAAKKRKPRSLDALVKAAPFVNQISAADARAWLPTAIALDVREPEELAEGAIAGAVHIPRGLLEREAPTKLPDRAGPLLVYCDDGSRSVLAAATLMELGYEDVRSLHGGFAAWQRASEGMG